MCPCFVPGAADCGKELAVFLAIQDLQQAKLIADSHATWAV